jgi:SHS family lactate transporter-like MFS transporter
MEKAPRKHRGFVSGLLQQGYTTGYLLAAVCYFFLFDRVGWRVLFFLGGLPALLALYVFFRVKESEVWRQSRHESWGSLGRALVSNWKLFLYLTVLMTTMAFVSHGTQDMYPTFLERQWGLHPTQRALLTAFSMIGAIMGGTLFGHLSDRIGRRRTIVISLTGCLLMTPLWAFAPTMALLVTGGFMMQFLVQGAWGVIPAHLAELSPDGVRGFLPGFAYQCGTLLAGSVAYIEAIFAHRTSYAIAMAATAGTVVTLAAITTLCGSERRGVTFGQQSS